MSLENSSSGSEVPDRPAIGPYELLQVVGRGGAGVVYRGQHATTGEVAAIKLLNVVAPEYFDRFRRETYMLGRLRHPGVVRVLDQGLDEAGPWYAMEFIEGMTLERLWARERDSWRIPGTAPPSPVVESLQLVRRLCQTLAFIHGEGVVHRDLKPGNVIVRTGGSPVLVDFGLVARFAGVLSREAIESGSAFAGSIDYMAPEQIRGEFVDARADLYALGCILYEALAARPPFIGDPVDVLQGHLATIPEPPSAHVAGVPQDLDALVLKLLAKEPRARIGYAVDVARELARFAPAPTDEDDSIATAPYLYRPSFIDREEVIGRLGACLDRAEEGHGGCVLIAGESGVGKTRLVMEFTRQAAARGFVVAAGECVPVEGRGGPSEFTASPLHPFGALLRMIADHCRLQGPAMTERLLGRRGKTLEVYEPALADLPGQETHPQPAALPPQAARLRLLQDLCEVISAFAREQGTVVVLDDLQWADELSLASLAALPSVIRDSARLLIVGTYRGEEASAALERLADSPELTAIDLHRMADRHVASIVSEMLALRELPPSLGEFVAAESEGNPFFLGEYLHTAISAGLLRRSDSGEWRVDPAAADADAYRALALPQSLQDLILRRLLVLTATARQAIEAAAVLGREFEFALAAELVGYDESQALESASELLRRQVVEDLDGKRLRFAHDKLREVAYAMIPSARRVLLHKAAATKIEARGPVADTLAVLAHHYSLAAVDDKALEYLGRAGEHALRTAAHAEARGLLSRALALDERMGFAADRLQRAHWLRLLGEAHLGGGDLDGMIARTHDALDSLGLRVPRSPTGWFGLMCAELARQAMGWLSPGRERGQKATSDSWIEAALASGQVANAFYYKSDIVRALTSSLRCANFAERGGAPSRATLAYGQLGYVAGGVGVHWLARRYFGRAYALRGVESDASADVIALYFGAMYEMGLGHWQKSEELGEAALELAERIGNRQEAEVARTVIANTLYYRGRFGDAAERCRAMLRSAESRSNVQHMGWGSFLIGRSLLALGAVDEAVELLERGDAYLKRTDDFVSSLMCQGLLAKALLRSGNAERAREKADELSRKLPQRPVPLAQCLDGYDGLAEVYLALWRANVGLSGEVPLRLASRRACKNLRRFSLPFPICRAAALRASGQEQWLLGRSARAFRIWRRGLRIAGRLTMPFEEAQIHLRLSHVTADAAERQQHREAAGRLLADLGCAALDAEDEENGACR